MNAVPVDPTTGEPYISVDVDAVDEAGRVIDSIVGTLDGDLGKLRDQAVAAVSAIPPSDLQNAYGYCWGRWSQTLLEGLKALANAGTAAHHAANVWRTTESRLVREAEEAKTSLEGG